MTFETINPQRLKEKLYQKEGDFLSYQDVTEEKLAEIAKKVYHYEEVRSKLSHQNTNLAKYLEILEFLTNPRIHYELPTFDEKVLFLIMAVDPNLITFKEFLKVNLPSINTINETEEPDEQEKLANSRSQKIRYYQTQVRSILGFYDTKLLKYEEKYFSKFLNQKELLTDIAQDNTQKFLSLKMLMEPLSTITSERFQELQEKAQTWLSLTDNNDIQTAIYSILKQNSLIGLKSFAEYFAFFVLVTDPSLDMLRIYEEESKINNIKKRIIEAFGYYEPELLSIEKEYHQAFCPDKKLSIWSK